MLLFLHFPFQLPEPKVSASQGESAPHSPIHASQTFRTNLPGSRNNLAQSMGYMLSPFLLPDFPFLLPNFLKSLKVKLSLYSKHLRAFVSASGGV
jgi:hypothetical protein